MKVFKEVIRKNRPAILLCFFTVAFQLTVFLLYDIMTEPLLYASAVSVLLLAVFLAADYVREKKCHTERLRAASSVARDWKCLPDAHSLAEEDYHAVIEALGDSTERIVAEYNAGRQDQLDYRLSGETNDLVLREYSLDELIRESVRKFAPLFLEKKLRLDFAPTEKTLITDKKWFGCILDQLISNAVKYTPSGTVSIGIGDGFLCISDTGIGIAPEDMPRIFERGYTGLNGRVGQKSSGLGLYLAKKAADMLALPLKAESETGEGSRFMLDLKNRKEESHERENL